MAPLILKTLSVSVLAFWLASLGYLVGECYGTGYDGPMWEWQYLGVDHWKALTTIESCMSWDVYKVAGQTGVRIWWNMPLLGILLWSLASLLNRRTHFSGGDDPHDRYERALHRHRRYGELDKQEIRARAKRRL